MAYGLAPMRQRRTRARTVTDKPSLLSRIDRALYRLQNTNGLPLKPLGHGGDPEPVLRACSVSHQQLRRVLTELSQAVLEQVGDVQTDRLRCAIVDARKILSDINL